MRIVSCGAAFLCSIRCTVVLACLIVEIVTTCAARMWVICVSPTFLGVPPCLFSDSHHTCCILVLCPSGTLQSSSFALSHITPTHFYLHSPRLLRYNERYKTKKNSTIAIAEEPGYQLNRFVKLVIHGEARSIKVLSMLYYGGLEALSNVCVITQEVFIPHVFLMKRRDCCCLL